MGRCVVHLLDCLYLLVVDITLKSAEHTIVGHLCRIGDERENGVSHIIVHRFQYGFGKQFAQFLALGIDVAVRTTAEIDSLKGTCGVSLALQDAVNAAVTVTTDNNSLAGLQLLHLIALYVERCLEHRALAGHGHHLVVAVVKGRTYAPRVAHGEHFAAAGEAADNVTAVEIGHGGLEHVAHLHVVIDVSRYVNALKPLFLGIGEVAFHLPVEPVSHPLQHYVAVGVYARALALCRYLLEHFVYVGHVKVSAEAKVLGFPVVPPQEGVHILQSALAGGRIAQVTHVEFSGKGQPVLGEMHV